MPKTATKTLQWRLFARHDEIYYLGRFDGPDFRKYGKLDNCRNEVVQNLMREIAYVKVRDPDFEQCAQYLHDALKPARKDNLVPVWSWESYSTDTLEMRQLRARNLKKVFGDAKILMTVRHPVDLIESAYLQFIKAKNVGRRRRFGSPPFLIGIDEWMKREWDADVRHHLEYVNTIQAYIENFGRERVHVLAFEQLRSANDAFFARICEILDVSSKQGIRLVEGFRDNTAWTQREWNNLTSVKASAWKSLVFRYSDNKGRQRMLGLAKGGAPMEPGPKVRIQLSNEWRHKIISETRDRNEWLAKEYRLPLEEFGYMGEQ